MKSLRKGFVVTKNKKTEHAGAKNGGGHWGTREEAKTLSKRLRRKDSKRIIGTELSELHRDVNFKIRRANLLWSYAKNMLDESQEKGWIR